MRKELIVSVFGSVLFTELSKYFTYLWMSYSSYGWPVYWLVPWRYSSNPDSGYIIWSGLVIDLIFWFIVSYALVHFYENMKPKKSSRKK